jgi:hypothetical protein
MRRDFILLICLTLLTLPTIATAQNLLNGPESVAFDSLRNRYLVNSLRNSKLVQIDMDEVQSLYMDLPFRPYGNHLMGDTLFVTTGNYGVYAIDLALDSIVMSVELPGPITSFDGLETDTSGYLYVVDTGGRIWKILISDQSISLFVASGLAPFTQDIVFDHRNNRLLAAGYSEDAPIQAISLTDSTVSTVIETSSGFFDGITMDPYGNVFVGSSTLGLVFKFEKTFTQPAELISSAEIEPAGLDYNWRDHILAVPNFGGDVVNFIPITIKPEVIDHIIYDDVSGDGDGIPEGGETVDLVVTLANPTDEQFLNTSINLSIEDASIVIEDGSADFGNIGPQDTVTNSGDPLVFSIPIDYIPRLDSFYLELIYDGGSDTIVFQQALGGIKILLVDDDDNAYIERYYTESFFIDRIPFDTWTALPGSDTADLNDYELVVWFTGDYRLPLDSYEVTKMSEYMDGGGKFFLTGQGIAYLLDLIDQSFLNNYLKADYLSNTAIPVLTSSPGCQVFADSDTLLINGGDGASNQTNPDHLAAINGGVGELNYGGLSDLGAVSYSGDYQLLYFAFGFEAIVSSDDRFLGRHDAFSKILDFFGYQKPATAPDIQDLMVMVGDPTHVTDHNPEISWVFSSQETRSQSAYQIQVGEDDDWEIVENWDTGPVDGSTQQVTYAGAELMDGQEYFIRVRVSNGPFWSAWETVSIWMNSIPIPTGLSPDGLQEVIEGTLALTHENLPDAEGDPITYTYEIYDDAEMSSLVFEATDQPSGGDPNTTLIVTSTLPLGEDYYWRVRANDGLESGQWSALASFNLVPAYICGDANNDDQVNVGDAVYIISYVFKGGPAPVPVEAGDANCDDQSNVGDAVYLINYVFKGGAEPCAECE